MQRKKTTINKNTVAELSKRKVLVNRSLLVKVHFFLKFYTKDEEDKQSEKLMEVISEIGRLIEYPNH